MGLYSERLHFYDEKWNGSVYLEGEEDCYCHCSKSLVSTSGVLKYSNVHCQTSEYIGPMMFEFAITLSWYSKKNIKNLL